LFISWLQSALRRVPANPGPKDGQIESTAVALIVAICVLLGSACQLHRTGSSSSTTAASQVVAPAELGVGEIRIELRPFVTGLTEPLFVTHAGDGSGDLYVVEKAGTIRVARGGTVAQRPFLDIRSLVNSESSERGLLGLAFHPNYRTNGYFYVNYTDRRGNKVIARYTATSDRATGDPTSALTILAHDQPFPNHNGGNLVFGPDGMLWIGTGDGGAGGDPFENGQSYATLLGKMLRIDVDAQEPYGIPSGNAVPGGPDARPEIWAIGLRNPWRYSFDRATGDLYIADVGQNAWEEVNFTPAGAHAGVNYGWNRMEGTHCYPAESVCDQTGLELPIVDYQTGPDGCAVTGGYVYRGSAYPAIAGVYIFADFCSGTIWGLSRAPDGTWRRAVLRAAPGGHAGYSSFGEDEAGELYLTALDRGIVYRVTAAP
jgi:glucose/arabinose dehydrogenase